MFSKIFIPTVAALSLLTGCDSNSIPVNQPAEGGLAFPMPEKIRTSLAVDFNQVSGVATVNDRFYEMERVDQLYQARVPDVPVNSEVSVKLLFTERQPDGRNLTLADTPEQTFSVATTDQSIRIGEAQYSYDFDVDNDNISNIDERINGTDPFIPENAGTRTVTVEFNIPQRINEPEFILVTVLIADRPRAPDRTGSFVRATGLVSNLNTIVVDVRLDQRFQNTPVPVAQSRFELESGSENITLALLADRFNFEFDSDEDGVLNIDELQAGTNPFVVGQ